MESIEQNFSSIDALKRHERKVDWEDDARFHRQAKALAEIDPEFAEWLEAHPEVLV